ncbi:MAG: UvrD-helicase domain-containing protein [Gammaproteobacteria bacterium]|nr:UvrD-helicase domain-containing protein [Gammaproteobacteria bacterium]
MSLDDAAARTSALDPAASFIVEAAAGSGKTSLLTQRMLVLLARVDEPEQVLAVTFTRKAVEEMRGRVLEALDLATGPVPAEPHRRVTHALATAVLARDATRGWRLRDQPTRLRIQTIDALAGGLARRLPLTAGLAAQLEVVDDASDLYRAAARATLACLVDADFGDVVEQVLEHLENDMRRLEALLVAMLARRDLWLPRVAAGIDRARAEAALAAVVDATATGVADGLRGAFGPAHAQLVDYARGAAASVVGQGLDTPIGALVAWDGVRCDGTICAALAELLLTVSGSPRKRPNKQQGVTPANKAELGALFNVVAAVLDTESGVCARLHAARALPPPVYTDAQWRTVEAACALLMLAAAQLSLVFADAGRCDFTAITEAACAALGAPQAPSDLALALDCRLEHLLVDEFQDTSAAQHALLAALTAGWTGDDGRTLFFVGDPLQSIYRFRQADVGLFIDTVTRHRFGAVSLTRLRLTANFRTAAPLVEWVNAALARAFVDAPALLPPYVALSATRAAAAHAPLAVYPLDAGDEGTHDAIDEALVVLRVIEEVRARRPRASLAVLVRGRTHLGALPTLLAAARIPVAASDIEPLAAAPVVNDLVLLTRALIQPADRIAWLGLLRAPWCGLDLATLTRLVEDRREHLIWEALHDADWRATLAQDARARVAALCAVLDASLARVRRSTWAALVEHTWLALRGPQLVADAQTLRHAERYFELLARFEATSQPLTAMALAAFVARHFAPVPRDADDAVQIMTVHRAKGLEFDVVILSGLERRVPVDSQVLALWVEHADAREHGPLLAPVPPLGVKQEPINTFIRRLEREEQRAEAYRLLYVGLTRARDELHLCARRDFDKDGELRTPPGSFLGMLRASLHDAVLDGPAPPRADLPLRPTATRQRLRADCLPMPSRAPVLLPPSPEERESTPVAKHVGTVTHLLLELVGRQGLAAWPPDAPVERVGFVRRELALRGVPRPALARATQRVQRALTCTLASTRGRWLFDERHLDCASERHYTAIIDGTLVDAVVDRVFVAHDADATAGTRWIVDFKTSEPGAVPVATFIAGEVARYRAQLEGYARILRMIEDRPIALGLYFPSFDGWYAWHWDGGPCAA